jgi:hypothetical protein
MPMRPFARTFPSVLAGRITTGHAGHITAVRTGTVTAPDAGRAGTIRES